MRTPGVVADAAVLHGALEEAVKVIRIWHGMKLPSSAEAQMWDLYWKNAPEMKSIREALER